MTNNKKYSKTYYEKNKEAVKERARENYKNNKVQIKNRTAAYARLKKYNLSTEQLKELFDLQNGICGICKCILDFNSRHSHVDHCHTTNKVRGFLCSKCNIGLGHFKDNTLFLEQAISYLKEHEIK